MSVSTEITPELLAGFLDEAPEYLEMLDSGLMDFESKAGSGVLVLDSTEDQEQIPQEGAENRQEQMGFRHGV